MRIHPIILSTAACLIATAVLADEPECGINYKADATSAETSVLTTLAPKAVIEALPRKLAAAGAQMDWATPAKGILKAGPLDVRAVAAGTVTRVIFHTSPAADQATLCRYATLVGNPPLPPAPPVPQDAALIAQMKNDLLIKHDIVVPNIGGGINHAAFRSADDFLQFTITGVKDLPNDKREYTVTMLLPRKICSIAKEDLPYLGQMMNGEGAAAVGTKPVRIESTVIYAKNGAAWKLADAFITTIESTK